MKYRTIGMPVDRYAVVLQDQVQFVFNNGFLFFLNMYPLCLGLRAAQRKALFESEYQISY
jgi:hypothetical protein